MFIYSAMLRGREVSSTYIPGDKSLGGHFRIHLAQCSLMPYASSLLSQNSSLVHYFCDSLINVSPSHWHVNFVRTGNTVLGDVPFARCYIVGHKCNVQQSIGAQQTFK